MIAIAKRHKVALELCNCRDGERRERLEQILERDGMTADELAAAIDEMLFSGNDIEGAAIGIAAVFHAYPDDHESDEYSEAVNRVLDQTCLLMRLQSEPNFPGMTGELQSKVDEMMDIIFDGAERIAAGYPLTA
jgi:hypothetical protein